MNHNNSRKLRLLLAAGLLWGSPVAAEEPGIGQPEADPRPVWTLTLENDLTNDTDRYYTNGIRLARVSALNDVPAKLVDAATPLIGTIGTVR